MALYLELNNYPQTYGRSFPLALFEGCRVSDLAANLTGPPDLIEVQTVIYARHVMRTPDSLGPARILKTSEEWLKVKQDAEAIQMLAHALALFTRQGLTRVIFKNPATGQVREFDLSAL